MPAIKRNVSLSEPAYAYAENLVARGIYPTLSAAISGELARASEEAAEKRALTEAEIARRMDLPIEQRVDFRDLDPDGDWPEDKWIRLNSREDRRAYFDAIKRRCRRIVAAREAAE